MEWTNWTRETVKVCLFLIEFAFLKVSKQNLFSVERDAWTKCLNATLRSTSDSLYGQCERCNLLICAANPRCRCNNCETDQHHITQRGNKPNTTAKNTSNSHDLLMPRCMQGTRVLLCKCANPIVLGVMKFERSQWDFWSRHWTLDGKLTLTSFHYQVSQSQREPRFIRCRVCLCAYSGRWKTRKEEE